MTTPIKHLVKLESLTKTYRTAEVETTALEGVNIDIREGEFVAIMGPSGCGKSTLLNVVGMLDNPSGGKYIFKGEDISRYSESQLADLRKKNLGFVFQSFNLIDELTVEGNIELALLYQNVSAAERKQRVKEAMERMKIGHRAKHFPTALSGGQQQRVAVARAVVSRPSLILADEPTGNLDSANIDVITGLLIALARERGKTVIVATHDPKVAEAFSVLYRMRDGQFVREP